MLRTPNYEVYPGTRKANSYKFHADISKLAVEVKVTYIKFIFKKGNFQLTDMLGKLLIAKGPEVFGMNLIVVYLSY